VQRAQQIDPELPRRAVSNLDPLAVKILLYRAQAAALIGIVATRVRQTGMC
jgi:hypothetical protein